MSAERSLTEGFITLLHRIEAIMHSGMSLPDVSIASTETGSMDSAIALRACADLNIRRLVACKVNTAPMPISICPAQ